MAAGLGGYVYRKMSVPVRLISIVGGLTLLYPGILSDVIGLVLVVGAVVWQRMGARKAAV